MFWKKWHKWPWFSFLNQHILGPGQVTWETVAFLLSREFITSNIQSDSLPYPWANVLLVCRECFHLMKTKTLKQSRAAAAVLSWCCAWEHSGRHFQNDSNDYALCCFHSSCLPVDRQRARLLLIHWEAHLTFYVGQTVTQRDSPNPHGCAC